MIDTLLAAIRERWERGGILVQPIASEEELAQFEGKWGVRLPPSGAFLFRVDWRDGRRL